VTRRPSREPSGGREPATDRDLFGQARRRLPPEVDVVALVSGAALAGAVALGGCGPPVSREDADASKAHVVGVSRDLLGRLAAVGTYKRSPRAAWSGCDDLGGHVAYRVSGRVDAMTGSPHAFLDEVRRTTDDAGFELTEVSTGTDPVTWQGEHDDVRVQLTGYAAQPLVLFSLTGPCLDVGASDEDLLAEAPERVDLR
jgi:hypothetical protein